MWLFLLGLITGCFVEWWTDIVCLSNGMRKKNMALMTIDDESTVKVTKNIISKNEEE